MTLTPTLASIEALYRKLERESYRAYHTRNRIHKADHFFNFCVTAHSLRDYFFERKGLTSKKDKSAYHDLWNREPLLVAVGEIANTTKHFTLRFRGGPPLSPRTKRTRTRRSGFVNVYTTPTGLRLVGVRAPDMTITLSDGTRHELYQFTQSVLHSWRSFLSGHGIRIRRQSFRQVAGPR